ncbi:MAG: hypothetical protein ABJA75_08310 [Bradyrhizobium sp.]
MTLLFRPGNDESAIVSVAGEGAINEWPKKLRRSMCTASLLFTRPPAGESWRSRKIAFVRALEWL